jgi:hypothetical protein
MKRIIILLAFLLIGFRTFASIADVFSINQTEVSQQMNDLTVLENYLLKHPSISYSDIEYSNQWLLSNVMQTKESPYITSNIFNYQQINVPDGCATYYVISCCIFVGILLVYYLVAEN